MTKMLNLKINLKRCICEVTEILKRHNLEFAPDLNGNFPFCALVLYKHVRTNDATTKHATQTDTITTQL